MLWTKQSPLRLLRHIKLYKKFSQLDTSFGTIMSLLISRFRDLNWDQVLNKKKGMLAVKKSLNNWIHSSPGETKVGMLLITSVKR